jgi:glycosyltransferase involved in cell wall biosynthesis
MMVRSQPVRNILFISNLFPRPDAPRKGLFNGAFAAALQKGLSANGGVLEVLVPVPEWRVWRWRAIRGWTLPPEAGSRTGASLHVRYVPCFYLPVIGRSLSVYFYRLAFRAAADAFLRADAVIGSWLYPDAVAALQAAAGYRKPVWIRLHGTDRLHLDSAVRGWVCHRALATAAGVMVNAAFMKAELVRRGIAADRITVIPNGIDRDVFRLETAIYTGQTICWVGNLVPIKQPDLALRAFAELIRLADTDSRLELVMVGQGPMRRRLGELARRLGIESRVRFAGSLPMPEVADIMRKARALLLTSRSEGMPNVVIEALACGTPVVATPVGDVPAFVKEGLNGIVVAASGPTEAAHRLAAGLHEVVLNKWNPQTIRNSVRSNDRQLAARTALQTMERAASCREVVGHDA